MDPILNIIKQYYPLLLRYARRIVFDKFVAEDIASHVLKQLLEQPSIYQNNSQLRTHLKTSTHIACYQWLLTQALQIRTQKPATGNHFTHRSLNIGGQPPPTESTGRARPTGSTGQPKTSNKPPSNK